MEDEANLIFRWWIVGIILFVTTFVILTVVSYLGLFTSTVVERKVFENSFQYSEARKTEILTFESQLAQIEVQLKSPSISDATRVDLESQKASISVLMNVAKRK